MRQRDKHDSTYEGGNASLKNPPNNQSGYKRTVTGKYFTMNTRCSRWSINATITSCVYNFTIL